MKRAMLLFVIMVAAFIVSGCEQKEKSNSPVLAKVGKVEITEDEYLKEINRIPDWAKSQFSGKEGKEKFLEELVKRELIYQDAKKMRLDKDPEYLEKMKEFEKMSLVGLILKKEVEDKAKVDDEEVKSFYEKNADKFTVGTKLRASHILLNSEDQAKKLYERIKKGESLSKLAGMYSIDKASAAKGGDLGYFGRGQMVPEFEQAAIRLKVGEVSEPVKSRFGYHVIQLTDIQKGEAATFEQTKEAIKRQLVAEKQKTLIDSFVEELRKKADVTKDEKTLDSISLPWEEEGKK